MRFLSTLTNVLSLITVISAASLAADPEAAARKQIQEYKKKYTKYVYDTVKTRKTGCTKGKLLVRKEWSKLTKPERLNYINAVYCLAKKPGTTPSGPYASSLPGARTRYDDFVGAHSLKTNFIHSNGLFLGFHRHYVHLYEKALREECGYKGAQPYWDWTIGWEDPRQTAVFDGSPWSLGSNGIVIPNRPPTVVNFPTGDILIPPGTGGGCVEKGPFTADKFTINLGPTGYEPHGPLNGTGYNPRCLNRDITLEASQNLKPSNVALSLSQGNLFNFSATLDGPTGVHGAGHFALAGMQLDVFNSPSDPAFWLHHAMVDLTWAVWQGQDAASRLTQVWGTVTSGNFPPSENATLDSVLNFTTIAPVRRLGDTISTIDGPFCYIYE
ncbi:Grixazone synthase [Naviculisporaceae sp. PSN 640]